MIESLKKALKTNELSSIFIRHVTKKPTNEIQFFFNFPILNIFILSNTEREIHIKSKLYLSCKFRFLQKRL
jgi:hypothetical protein